MANYKAAKYIRLSYTDDKSSESDSVQNQRKLLENFIESQPDLEAVKEYIDDGVSGVIFDRPAFTQMMNDIKSGLIYCVIVKDLSRLGREYIETGRHLRYIFPAYGVRFIALNDNIDTLRENNDNLMMSVRNVINDSYSRDISKKTRSALGVKRGNGDYVGAFPIYGYQKAADNHNKLAVDEYPASVVRDIFRMKLEGASALRIAETLNSLGVLSPLEYKKSHGLPHPKGGYADKNEPKWSATTILRILQDETYTGTLIQGRQGKLNHKIQGLVSRPESEWVRSENAHEAIVSKLDFDLARKIMRLDTRTAPGGEKVYNFSGVLICGCCGARMTRKTVPYKGEKYHYYYCPTGKKNGCADGVNLKETELCDCVLESVKAHIANVASLEAIMEGSDSRRVASTLAKQHSAQIEDNERQLAQIVGFKSALYENMINGLLSKEDYKAFKRKYTADENRLRAAISVLNEQLDNVLAGKGERLRWMEQFKQFEGLTEIDRRIVANLIHTIRVDGKAKLSVTFNYQAEYENALALLRKGAA